MSFCKTDGPGLESRGSSQSEISACQPPFGRFGRWTWGSRQIARHDHAIEGDCSERTGYQLDQVLTFELPWNGGQTHPFGKRQKFLPFPHGHNTGDLKESRDPKARPTTIAFGSTPEVDGVDGGTDLEAEEGGGGNEDRAGSEKFLRACRSILGDNTPARVAEPGGVGHDEPPIGWEAAGDTESVESPLPGWRGTRHRGHCPEAAWVDLPVLRRRAEVDGGGGKDLDSASIHGGDGHRLLRERRLPRSLERWQRCNNRKPIVEDGRSSHDLEAVLQRSGADGAHRVFRTPYQACTTVSCTRDPVDGTAGGGEEDTAEARSLVPVVLDRRCQESELGLPVPHVREGKSSAQAAVLPHIDRDEACMTLAPGDAPMPGQEHVSDTKTESRHPFLQSTNVPSSKEVHFLHQVQVGQVILAPGQRIFSFLQTNFPWIPHEMHHLPVPFPAQSLPFFPEILRFKKMDDKVRKGH